MLSLKPAVTLFSAIDRQMLIIIHKAEYNEAALDFILAANNLTENISVIFIQAGVQQISYFKALKGFEIEAVYAEKESMDTYQIVLDSSGIRPTLISSLQVKNHVAHCQQIFTF
jgi:sulfur relay (sulfurtransferase) DsrF/TusC family protein